MRVLIRAITRVSDHNSVVLKIFKLIYHDISTKSIKMAWK